MRYKSIAYAAAVAAALLMGCAGDNDVYPNNPGVPNNEDEDRIEKGNDINNYKVVRIGTQTWIAQNLDYAIEGSVCYDSSSSNCARYGRLYTWDAAMRACPSGWHLPNDDEWMTLTYYVGSSAGIKLKSGGNGTNEFGFSANLGGYGDSDGNFSDISSSGYWWSATKYDVSRAWYRYMSYYNDGVHVYNDYETKLYSVRCLQDL